MVTVSELDWRFDKGYTSMPWANLGLVGANGRHDWIDIPYNSSVRDKDTLCQRRPVMGTVRTRCVDFIT